MNVNSPFSSFMMLTEHLYEVFVQYITQGRNRAPPETELIEMIPTFQLGARTDRKALQSKFKSWAKRMQFENGELTLTSSGKIIIPRERCDDLIMNLHSEEHQDIENLISQIRMKYTWTKKNFGMDRCVVTESLLRNCQREECLRNMRMEMARLGTSLCTSTMNSGLREPFPGMPFGMPPPLPCLPPYPYRWPLAFPVPALIPPGNLPIRIPFFNDMCNMGNPMVSCNKMTSNAEADQKVERSNSGKEHNMEDEAIDRSSTSKEMLSTSRANVEEHATALKFRKPKTVYEFRAIVEAARRKPEEFPDVLGEKKTQFLSVFGIAPKSVCSTRTLRKLRKELKYKRLINIESMIYGERKILRDKNKLRKNSHQEQRHLFLGMAAARNDSTPRGLENTTIENKLPRFLKVSRKLNNDQNKDKMKSKEMEISPKKQDEIEVIDIVSSDDEAPQQEKASVVKKDEEVRVYAVSSSPIQPVTVSTNSTDETAKKLFDDEMNKISKESGGKNVENNKNEIQNKNVSHHRSENDNTVSFKSENYDKIGSFKDENHNKIGSVKDESLAKHHTVDTEGEIKSLGKQVLNETDNKFPTTQPVLLQKVKNVPIISKLNKLSNISTEQKTYQVPKTVTSGIASRTNGVPNYSSANYSFTTANTTPILIQKLAPPNVQQAFVVSDQNNISRILCPVVTSASTTNVKLLLTDKDQKGKFYIIPQYSSSSILPQNFSRNGSQVTFESKVPTVPVCVPAVISQLHQVRQKTREKDATCKEKLVKNEKSKIDINEEMMRISSWIYRMKANLDPNMFQHSVEKSVHKLISQLDVGIYLVREAKKALVEIESSLDHVRSTEISE